MTGGTKRCISVSTLAEAEFYSNGGYDDITYAYPLSPDKVPQAAQLLSRLEKFHVLVDNCVILDALTAYPLPDGKKWSVFLKVNCGYNRGKFHHCEDAAQLQRDGQGRTFWGVVQSFQLLYILLFL